MDSRAEEELLKNFHSFRSFGRPVKNFEYETEKFFYGASAAENFGKTWTQVQLNCRTTIAGSFFVTHQTPGSLGGRGVEVGSLLGPVGRGRGVH